MTASLLAFGAPANAANAPDVVTFLNQELTATHSFIDGEQAFIDVEVGQTQRAIDDEQAFLNTEWAATNKFVDDEQNFLANGAHCTGTCFNLQPFIDDEQTFWSNEEASLQRFTDDEQTFAGNNAPGVQRFIDDEQAFMKQEQAQTNAFIAGEQAFANSAEDCAVGDACDDTLAGPFDTLENSNAFDVPCAFQTEAQAATTTEIAATEGAANTSPAPCDSYHQTTYHASGRMEEGDSGTNGSYSHKIDNRLAISHCSFSAPLYTDHNYKHCTAAVELINKKGDVRPGTKFQGAGSAGQSIGQPFGRQPGYPVCTSLSGAEQYGGDNNASGGSANLYASCYYIYG